MQISEPRWKKASSLEAISYFLPSKHRGAGGKWETAIPPSAFCYGKQGNSMWTIKKAGAAPDSSIHMKETPPLSRNFLCLEATEIGYRSRNPRPPPGPSGGQPSVPAAPTLSLRSVQRKLTPICRALRLDIRSHPPLDQLENQRFIQGIGHLLCQAQGREDVWFSRRCFLLRL